MLMSILRFTEPDTRHVCTLIFHGDSRYGHEIPQLLHLLQNAYIFNLSSALACRVESVEHLKTTILFNAVSFPYHACMQCAFNALRNVYNARVLTALIISCFLERHNANISMMFTPTPIV